MRVTSATLLLPPLCFCINCPLERVALDLSHPSTPPSPFPLHHCRSPFQLVAWGVVAHPPDSNPPPTPQTLMVSWESVDGR